MKCLIRLDYRPLFFNEAICFFQIHILLSHQVRYNNHRRSRNPSLAMDKNPLLFYFRLFNKLNALSYHLLLYFLFQIVFNKDAHILNSIIKLIYDILC